MGFRERRDVFREWDRRVSRLRVAGQELSIGSQTGNEDRRHTESNTQWWDSTERRYAPGWTSGLRTQANG